MLSFFPQDILDEILNLIESVSEGFPSFSCNILFDRVEISAKYQYGTSPGGTFSFRYLSEKKLKQGN